jgi:hypothetical protein
VLQGCGQQVGLQHLNAGETLERFQSLWSTGTALEQKKLLRSAVAAVLIRGKLVRAVQLREAFYPFVPYRNGRNHGSDGGQLAMWNTGRARSAIDWATHNGALGTTQLPTEIADGDPRYRNVIPGT